MTNERAFKLEASLKIQLLLVDDEQDFRDIIRKRLTRLGVQLHLADCCEACLAVLEEHPIDVIIMDVSMPKVDGIQGLKMVKERWPLVEVIILTGHASVKSGIEGMQGGAFDYCLKPIDVLELLEKVELAAQKALINRE